MFCHLFVGAHIWKNKWTELRRTKDPVVWWIEFQSVDIAQRD